MKKELHLYLLVCSLILIASIFQSNVFKERKKKETSNVNTLDSFRQLLVEIDCNIFVIEGENQNILIEGSSELLNAIETVNNSGCITIHRKHKSFLKSVLALLSRKHNKINIYITVNNFDDFNILPVKSQLNIKYSSRDRIGLILDKGQKFLIESKEINKCV